MQTVDIDKAECESILSSIKYSIGLINSTLAIQATDKNILSFDLLLSSVPSIAEIQNSLRSSLVSFRVIGTWVCAMGLYKDGNINAQQRLKVCMFLASGLTIIDETIKDSSSKGIIQNLVDSMRVDLSVEYATHLIDITKYADAYKYLYKAKKLKWKDTNNLVEKCTAMLGDQVPLDDSDISQRSLSDGQLLLRGKPPLRSVEFRLVS
jgi:hypothetical protein